MIESLSGYLLGQLETWRCLAGDNPPLISDSLLVAWHILNEQT